MGSRLDTALDGLLRQFKRDEAVGFTIPKLLAAIEARFEDTDAMLYALAFSRWLDTAIGIWLDQVGNIIGIYPRPAKLIPAETTFAYRKLTDPGDPLKGFGSLAAPGTGGHFETIAGVSSGELVDDETYRSYLLAKVIAVSGNTSIPSIWTFINKAFGADPIVTRPKPGFVEVELDVAIAPHERRILVDQAPIGAGVDITIKNWPT
jgi:hypothetical protein